MKAIRSLTLLLRKWGWVHFVPEELIFAFPFSWPIQRRWESLKRSVLSRLLSQLLQTNLLCNSPVFLWNMAAHSSSTHEILPSHVWPFLSPPLSKASYDMRTTCSLFPPQSFHLLKITNHALDLVHRPGWDASYLGNSQIYTVFKVYSGLLIVWLFLPTAQRNISALTPHSLQSTLLSCIILSNFSISCNIAETKIDAYFDIPRIFTM